MSFRIAMLIHAERGSWHPPTLVRRSGVLPHLIYGPILSTTHKRTSPPNKPPVRSSLCRLAQDDLGDHNVVRIRRSMKRFDDFFIEN